MAPVWLPWLTDAQGQTLEVKLFEGQMVLELGPERMKRTRPGIPSYTGSGRTCSRGRHEQTLYSAAWNMGPCSRRRPPALEAKHTSLHTCGKGSSGPHVLRRPRARCSPLLRGFGLG
jgi:hypothetical protein